VRELLEAYEITAKKINFIELLFVIHTYYALVIKLLAAEITVTYASPFMRSFLDELLSASPENLRKRLRDLEEGGIFSEHTSGAALSLYRLVLPVFLPLCLD